IIMLPVAECNMSDYLTTLDAMELGTERDELRRRALQWPGCLIRAFDYLHDKRTKHRDVKPSNILIKGGTVYLADFGISKMVDGDETTGSYGYVGAHTRNYSAPEVLEEEDETRRGRSVDIYSLGCIFLELATVLIAPPHSR
ncbi:kinase-like protein, partial [Polyplosphaeria fusca]